MQIDPKLRKARRRSADILQRLGYRISFAWGVLAETFTLVADSVYFPSMDSGLYVKVVIDSVDKKLLDNIMAYQTNRKKELWVMRFEGKSNAPGRFYVFRIQGDVIIDSPIPVDEIILSSGKKMEVSGKKKKVTPSKQGVNFSI